MKKANSFTIIIWWRWLSGLEKEMTEPNCPNAFTALIRSHSVVATPTSWMMYRIVLIARTKDWVATLPTVRGWEQRMGSSKVHTATAIQNQKDLTAVWHIRFGKCLQYLNWTIEALLLPFEPTDRKELCAEVVSSFLSDMFVWWSIIMQWSGGILQIQWSTSKIHERYEMIEFKSVSCIKGYASYSRV